MLIREGFELETSAPAESWTSHLWNPEWFHRTGAELGCGEQFTILDPDLILEEHGALLKAGVSALSTNTCGASASVMRQYTPDPAVWEVNRQSAVLARRAVEQFSSKRPVLVLGSVGPTLQSLSFLPLDKRDITALRRSYEEQIDGLVEGGSDILHIEACRDCLNAQTAYEAVQNIGARRGFRCLTVLSGTIEATGQMLDGTTAEEWWQFSRKFDPLKIGFFGSPPAPSSALSKLPIHRDVPTVIFVDSVLAPSGVWPTQSADSFASDLAGLIETHRPSAVGFGPGTRPAFIEQVIRLFNQAVRQNRV